MKTAKAIIIHEYIVHYRCKWRHHNIKFEETEKVYFLYAVEVKP